MDRINRSAGRGARTRSAVGAGIAVVAAVLLMGGCSSNTPTAAGPTVTVTTAGQAVTVTTAVTQTVSPTTADSVPGATDTVHSTASGAAPTLPDKLAGLDTLAIASKAVGGDRATVAIEANGRTLSLTEQAYAKAYGAPAVAQSYSSSDLKFNATVIVVTAASPGLTRGPVGDPADLGLAVNLASIVDVGDAQCEVNTGSPVPTGSTPDPEKAFTTRCQRTGPGLTVMVYGVGNGTNGQQQMVDLVDAAWSAVGGT